MRRIVLTAIVVMSWVILPVGSISAQQMVFPGEDWERATAESQFVDSTRLEEAVRFLEGKLPSDGRGVEEMVVIRNGRMIWEGPNIDRVHNVASVTKSVTSTLLGLLVDDGRASLDMLAKEYIPSLAEDYSAVTLGHFASMTSPYRAVGEMVGSQGETCTPLTPDEPLFDPPGSQFKYSNVDYELFGYMIADIAQQSLQDFFRLRIADPIGMGVWSWGNWDTNFGHCPDQVVDGVAVDGTLVNTGSFDLQISAKDAARFGLLILNEGEWEGQQLISREWLREATTVQVPVSTPVHPGTYNSGSGPGVYGYGWWTNGVKPDGERFFPGATPETITAIGLDNNRISVVPEWEIVIVREGQNESGLNRQLWGSFLAKVGEALIVLQAGDADMDLDFDQLDLVQVQIASKYLTGEPATWGEGDWNGAPGGFPGSPPQGDGVFNQLDIVAAQQAAVYLTGPYAASTNAAVPEPNSLALLVAGLVVFVGVFRRGVRR